MNTKSFTQKGLLLQILFSLLISLSYGCSSSSVPEDGILPDEYNWAYGWWRVTKDSGEDYERAYDLIINGSTLQSNDGYIRFGFKDEGLYPVYTMPELSFTIVDDEDLNLQNDELCLYIIGIGGYDEYIILNKTNKTVAKDAICTKVKDKMDPALYEQYEKDLAAIPIEGDWKNTRKGSDIVRIQHSPTDILTKKGNIITYENGDLLSYDSEKDQLSITYGGIEDGDATFTYKRYDKKAELYERGNRIVAGHEYTAEIGDYGDDPYRLTFSFEEEGKGRRTYYCMTPFGGAVAEKGTFYWEYLDDKHFLVAYHDESSDDDVIKVLAIKSGNFEQLFNSSIYLEDNTRNKYYLDFDTANGSKRYLDRLYDKDTAQDKLFQSFVEGNSFKQLFDDETTYSYSFNINGECDRLSITRVYGGSAYGNDKFKWKINDGKVVVYNSDGNQVEVFTISPGEVDLEIEDSHGTPYSSNPSPVDNSLFFRSSQAEKYGEPYTPRFTNSQLASIQDEVSGLQEQSKEDMLIGRSYSHMSDGLGPNTIFLHEYVFAKNNVCIMSFYEINAVGNYRIRERSPQRWEIVGNKVRIYDPSVPSASKYDDFKIGYNCIIDQTGKIYD